MTKKKSPKKDQGQPWEEHPITQEMLDEFASLPSEQFQRKMVEQFHELYLQLAATINWTAEQRDMVGKTFAEAIKTLAKGHDERLRVLEQWAFSMTILFNQMRGCPPDIKRNREIAEMFLVDFDGTLKEAEA
ncbi:MAG: hypothetical protein Q7O12_14310 [Deltaproteobacteria bacterium]|nr:hypothetical protein [Deltaproteobacteria bacterium]